MIKKYIATGLNMLDAYRYSDGSEEPPHLGGIPMYGYCGMRFWTDSIEFVARVGEDFFDYFDPWFSNNGIDTAGLKVVSKKTPYNVIVYDEDLNATQDGYFFTKNWLDTDYYRPHSEDVEPHIGVDTKGFYITGGPQPAQIWDGLFKLRDKFGFKIMWEPNSFHTQPRDKEKTLELCKYIEMASFNLLEGKRIFGVESEQELIELLKNLGPELVLLRCGERGLYSIHNKKAYFIPSIPVPKNEDVVDVTGCGNTATAAACVAWCEGDDPIMTGIKANISANYNLRQLGPYPLFTDDVIEEANKMAQQYYKKEYKVF